MNTNTENTTTGRFNPPVSLWNLINTLNHSTPEYMALAIEHGDQEQFNLAHRQWADLKIFKKDCPMPKTIPQTHATTAQAKTAPAAEQPVFLPTKTPPWTLEIEFEDGGSAFENFRTEEELREILFEKYDLARISGITILHSKSGLVPSGIYAAPDWVEAVFNEAKTKAREK